MTEQEFFQQIWRPYDIITIEGGFEGSLINICFPTRSVRISMPSGSQEWFRCELIQKHTPRTGKPDDLSTIAALHDKLGLANYKIEKQKEVIATLQDIIKQLKEKQQENSQGARVEELLKAVRESLVEKKKRVERNQKCMDELEAIIENFHTNNQ